MEKQKLYKRAIIKEMFFAGPSTLAELSDKTDKSIPFVTKLLNELKDENCMYLFAPTGGFSGSGDGTHPDFRNEAIL